MNLLQARELTIKYLEPFLAKNNFSVKLNKSKQATIQRKRADGFDIMTTRLLDYNPAYRIEYGFRNINNTVNSIMLQLQSKVKLQYEYDDKSYFVYFAYHTINNISEVAYLPAMSSEPEVQECCNMIIDFMSKTALPLLDKLEDIREIDKIINGDEPWDDDWRKPFGIGNNFGYYRLIVAKLAGNPNFDELVDLNYKQREALSAKNGYPYTYERSNLNKPLPALIEILKSVEPLYG